MPSRFGDLPPALGDRRAAERHLACFPAWMQLPGGEPDVAMIHDLSTTGAMLLARALLAAGDHVHLRLFVLDESDRFRETGARVVRIETLPAEAIALWDRRVAVEFDAPLAVGPEEVEAFQARTRALGLR